MKNLKKLLAVVLVVAMAFSFAAVASAENPATKFSDGASVKNVAAVDLLTGLGIIEGNEGAFNPTGTLTREQAAKIVAYLLNGAGAANLKAASAPFSDVAKDRWSAGYIAFCVGEGIIAGTGDGTFNPEGKLNGVAWAKMLLCALGYDATAEGFTGPNWNVNIVKVLNKVGLTVGLSLDLNADISRDDACAMAYKTLTANMVEYPTSGTTITIGDTTIQTGAGKAEPMANSLTADASYNGTADNIMQFCELYFPDLDIFNTTKFGNNGYLWRSESTLKPITDFYITDKLLGTSYAGTTVTRLTDPSDTKFVARIDGAAKFYSNGALIDTGVWANDLLAADGIADDGFGVVVNLYDAAPYDGDVDVVTIIKKNVAQLGINPVKTVTTGAVTTVTVSGGIVPGVNSIYVKGYEGLAFKDVVLYYTLTDSGTNYYFIEKAKSFTGTQTGFTDSLINTFDMVTIGGQYYFASGLPGVSYTADGTYMGVADVTYYLDDGGYIVWAVPTSAVYTLDNYVFIKDCQRTTDLIPQHKAIAVFMDGTSGLITIAKTGLATGSLVVVNDADFTDAFSAGELTQNTFYTYTKNTDGTYNLRMAVGTQAHVTDAEIDADFTTVKAADFLGDEGTALANANTTFVYQSNATGLYSKYTGVANAPKYTIANNSATNGIYVLMDSVFTAYASAVVGFGGTADATVSGGYEQVFVTGGGTETYDPVANYYVYPAYVNGEFKMLETTSAVTLTPGELYMITSYVNGKVDSVITRGNATFNDLVNYVADTKMVSAVAGTLSVDSAAGTDASYLLNANVKAFVYDCTTPSGIPTMTEISVDQLVAQTYADDNEVSWVVEKSDSDDSVVYVYLTIINP